MTKKIFLVAIISLGILLVFNQSNIALAGNFGNAINDQIDNKTNDKTANDLIKKAIDFVLYIIGIASVIMIIYGGFKYTTSGGDAGKVGEAKKTITYAVIGVVVAILANLIVGFALKL